VPLFNPKNEVERQREAIIQERNRMIMERRAIPPLRKEFNRVAKVASQPDANMPIIIVEHQRNIQNILRRIYAATIRQSAMRTVREAPKSAFLNIEKKDLEGEIARLISTWIFTHALLESSLISGTTQSIIVDILAENIGESEIVIGKAIREAVGGNIGISRARTIARTETHDASQDAQLQMVETMNFPPDSKDWVVIRDGRERKSHRNVKKVPLNSDFDVGGKKMSRPGDRRGGAAEVINCRCVMIFVDNDV